MTTEIQGLIEEQGKAFAEFKAKVDLEISGKADAVIADEIKTLNTALDTIGAKLKDMEAKAARPSAAAEAEAVGVEQKAALREYFRTGRLDPKFEAKAATTTTDASGGFAVPKIIDPVVVNRLVDISPVRSVARVVQAASRDYRILVNRRGTGAGWVGETAARPETNTPILQEIAPPSGELYANPAATNVMLEDAFFNVESWIADNVDTEWARAEAAAFITGDGTNKPQGFIKGTPVATGDATRAAGVLQFTASGSAATLPTTLDPYVDIVASLKAGHRANAIWMLSKTSVASIRKVKASDGQFLWQPSLQAGMPATFMGYPVVEAEDMPAVAANAFPVAFGNFMAGYVIVDMGSPVVIRDVYSNKPFVHFYSCKRVGGDLVDAEAIKLLKCAA